MCGGFISALRRNVARRRWCSGDRRLASPAESFYRRRLHGHGGGRRTCAPHCLRILRLLAEGVLAGRRRRLIPRSGAGIGVKGRGEASIAPERTAAKSPALAGVLSVLIIGLGHWYLGRWRRALAWEGALLALAFAVTALNVPDAVLSTVALALAGSSGVDAWRVANEMNAQRQAVEGRLTG